MPSVEKESIRKILQQPFTYFSKGSQSYVFLSEDGNYVLKLFKQHKRKKLEETYTSCSRAFHFFRENTGVVHLHLNHQPEFQCQVLCIDKKGKSHLIEIDKTAYLLQKKAELVYPALAKRMEAGKREEARALLSSLFSLLHEFSRRGVYANDPILRKNFGFIDDHAVQIDIGKFQIDPAAVHLLNVEEISTSLQLWIDSHYPELSKFAETLRKSSPTL
jgi:hypothetical protein